MLVAQFGDEREFVFDLRAHLGRHARRPVRGGAGFGERTQVLRWGAAFGHHLGRILVTQLVQRPARAALRDHQGLAQQVGREALGQPHAGAQVLLGVGREGVTAVGQRSADAGGGQHVLQRLARAHVHVHVAHRHQRHRGERAGIAQVLQVQLVVKQAQLRHAQPAAAEEGAEQPARDGTGLRGRGVARRHGDGDAVGQGGGIDAGQGQVIGAFFRSAAQACDELAQVAVAVQAGGQQHQREVAGVRRPLHAELAAHDERQLRLLGRHVGLRDAGHGAFVGEGQGGVTHGPGARDQFVRMARAPQEAEVGAAQQLGDVGQGHGEPSGEHTMQVPRGLVGQPGLEHPQQPRLGRASDPVVAHRMPRVA